MTSSIVRSHRGIAFTHQSEAAIQRYFDGASENKCVLVLTGAFDEKGQPFLRFGVDRKPQPSAVSDEVARVLFYWLADQSTLDRLREDWCVDAEWGRSTRAIPLPKDEG